MTRYVPLYMDVHQGIDRDVSTIMEAHRENGDVQERYGVSYRRCWIDEREGVAFCLFEAPDKRSGEAVHTEAHGVIADEIFEVEPGRYPGGRGTE